MNPDIVQALTAYNLPPNTVIAVQPFHSVNNAYLRNLAYWMDRHGQRLMDFLTKHVAG